MLEQLTDTKQFNASSLSNFVLPMFCVECIKAVIKNDRSMELIVSVPDYAYKLVQGTLHDTVMASEIFNTYIRLSVIDSDSFAVRSNAVQLLSALAYYSERGCRVTLEALKRFQVRTARQNCKRQTVVPANQERTFYQSLN